MDLKLKLREPLRSMTPSPRLIRSRSGAENNSSTINNSQRFTNRSKSTTRSSRANNNSKEDNYYNMNTSQTTSSSKTKKATPDQELANRGTNSSSSTSRDSFVRFLQRDHSTTRNSTTIPKRQLKSPTGSPSAWALSPGRSLYKGLPAPKPINGGAHGGDQKKKVKGGGGGGGGVSGVLRYFRLKKVNPIQEEECHKLKLLHNRLLQWRFANARAQTAMASVKAASEDKLFRVWFRILSTRNLVMERRIHIQKLKYKIKLCEIVNGQMGMLNDWSKIEGKNFEAVSRVSMKLSALSLKIPLNEDAKGDVESIYAAMSMAMVVMDDIQSTISKFLAQVEKTVFLLTEITNTVENQQEKLEEIEEVITCVSQLVTWERSLRAELLQLAKD